LHGVVLFPENNNVNRTGDDDLSFNSGFSGFPAGEGPIKADAVREFQRMCVDRRVHRTICSRGGAIGGGS